MATYSVELVRYDGKKGTYEVGTSIRSVDAARKRAYDSLRHSGLNAEGKFKAYIYKHEFNRRMYLGELMNTADDTRYWYPEAYKHGGAYRKYPVRPDGTLGKGMW